MNSLNSLEGCVGGMKTNPDGSLYQVMPKVGGKPFRCHCGCNVFHQPELEDNIYICNACDEYFLGE